ncbi:hypothetical protein BKA70DRAFT_710928 [Coprinopsis sp. MPI-PUGE-AT-0042]|nr:hypothetical protein BKA70DRAFT_710928 [Coprinopsis sp. MPI-PUGE-AT-0042]
MSVSTGASRPSSTLCASGHVATACRSSSTVSDLAAYSTHTKAFVARATFPSAWFMIRPQVWIYTSAIFSGNPSSVSFNSFRLVHSCRACICKNACRNLQKDRHGDPPFKSRTRSRNDGLKLHASRHLLANVNIEVTFLGDDRKVMGLRKASLEWFQRTGGDE